jgi:hypothetical protein
MRRKRGWTTAEEECRSRRGDFGFSEAADMNLLVQRQE